MTNQNWNEEFQTFLQVDEVDPPEDLSQSVLKQVETDLRPTLWRVLRRVALVHLLVGTATLSVCPQFGVALGKERALFEFLMRYGHAVCTATCGAFFLGVSALIASFVLQREEVRLLRQHRVTPWVSLGLFSLMVFHIFGENVLTTMGLIWLSGAVLGAGILSEVSWKLRMLLRNRWAY